MDREEAVERNKATIVRNLLCNTDHDIKTIAKLVEVSVDFVIEIKNSLQA